MRAKKMEKDHMEFVSRLHKSKIPENELKLFIEQQQAESKAKLAKWRELHEEDKNTVRLKSSTSPRKSPRRDGVRP
jgi:hypothetical protein